LEKQLAPKSYSCKARSRPRAAASWGGLRICVCAVFTWILNGSGALYGYALSDSDTHCLAICKGDIMVCAQERGGARNVSISTPWVARVAAPTSMVHYFSSSTSCFRSCVWFHFGFRFVFLDCGNVWFLSKSVVSVCIARWVFARWVWPSLKGPTLGAPEN
jgi:hypothetical protein